jgi:Ribosomal protein L6P/L9E
MIVVKGSNGTQEREFVDPQLRRAVEGRTIKVTFTSKRRKDHALAGTVAAHLKNMMIGVTKGYEARLKVIYSHFPMKLQVEGNTFIVQNFMGGRSSKKTEILDGVKVEVKKDDVIVTGPNKEDVGQTAGRIEQITKVTGFDRRVFQDGIHLTAKTQAKE